MDPEVKPDGSRLSRVVSLHDLQTFLSRLPPLSDHHLDILKKSAISESVIEKRGYRSLENPELLKIIGISKKHGPGIVIPIRSWKGSLVSLQIRFDIPATITDKSGKRKKLRYLGPPDMDLRVDFPEQEIEEGGRVWITEGAKKADSLRSLGEYAISVSGVWGWSPPPARHDLEEVEWEGREVIVAYDSDVETNPGVRKAEAGLVRFLKEKGASIFVVRFPSGEEGEKTGVDDFLVSGNSLTDLESLIQLPVENWKNDLVYSESSNTIKITGFNLLLILQNDPESNFKDVKKNELSGLIEYRNRIPIPESDYGVSSALIEGSYKCGYIPPEFIRRAVEIIGSKNKYNPVCEYLDSLVWDKKNRIETIFSDFCGTPDSEYSRAVGKNLLVSSVARAYDPGCKVDTVVILEGPQGTGKSRFVVVLFGSGWTTTSRAEIRSKDFVSGILGFWGVELSELSSIRKSEIEHIKLTLSAESDDIRLPFRRDTERFPRRCVFIGTTNETEYLPDATGNRRFLPIRCLENIDLFTLEKTRDQLWAEAVHRFKTGSTWWEFPNEATSLEQEMRFEADSWEELILPWAQSPTHDQFSTSEILSDCLGIEIGKHSRQDQIRVGKILKRIGYHKKRTRRNGEQINLFSKIGSPSDD